MGRPLPVFRRALQDSWRSLLGWGAGLAGVLLLYLPLYPSIAGDGQMQELLDSFPPELINTLGFRDIVTGAGYTQSTVFGLLGFVLITIATVSWGSAAIAGAEESGRLELELAHGVGRGRYVLEVALGILARLLLLGVWVTLLLLVVNGPSELGIEPPNAVAATAALLGLGALTAAVALAIGALTGRKAAATGAAAGIAVLGYVLNAIANQSEDLEMLRVFSPYAWAYREQPLSDGADWLGLALLWGSAVVFTAIAALALRRRDVTG